MGHTYVPVETHCYILASETRVTIAPDFAHSARVLIAAVPIISRCRDQS